MVDPKTREAMDRLSSIAAELFSPRAFNVVYERHVGPEGDALGLHVYAGPGCTGQRHSLMIDTGQVLALEESTLFEKLRASAVKAQLIGV